MLWVVSFVFFVGFIAALRNYFNLVDNFGDGGAYMSLASATRHWDFRGIVIKQFWGLPYAMAALSRLTGASDRAHCCSSASCFPWWAHRVAGFSDFLSTRLSGNSEGAKRL